MKISGSFFLFFLLFNTTISAQTLFDTTKINEIKISFDTENWSEQLSKFKDEAQGTRLLGDVEINGVLYENAGIRYKGNSSYNFLKLIEADKFPFNIKLNHTNKKQKLPDGTKTLKLANNFRDPSFIREILAYDIARDFMPASHANFANVYVNGELFGLYTLAESVDNALLDHYFDEHKGVFFKCDPNYSFEAPDTCPLGSRSSLMYLGSDSTCYMGYYEIKSKDGWGELIKLTHTLNKDLKNIENILDVDQALWMLAFDNYIVNLDSYIGAFSHNYYLYQDRAGVFHPIIWDLNLAFGGFRLPNTKKSYNNEELKKLSMFVHFKETNKKRPLITNLLSNELYRKVYIAHMKTMVEDLSKDSTLYHKAHAFHQMAKESVLKDKHKLYTDEMFEASLTTTLEASKEKIIGIFDLMEGRNEYLKNHIVLTREAPLINEVQHSIEGEKVVFSADIENAQKVWLCYRTEKGLSFKRVALQKEADAGKNKWTGDLPYQEKLQYYFIAEGQYNATLSPRKASFEFYSID